MKFWRGKRWYVGLSYNNDYKIHAATMEPMPAFGPAWGMRGFDGRSACGKMLAPTAMLTATDDIRYSLCEACVDATKPEE